MIARARPVRPGYWFRPKLFGWGATPVTWQGWAVTLAGTAALIADIQCVWPIAVRVALGIAIVVILIAVAQARTDGAWRWRWRGEDR